MKGLFEQLSKIKMIFELGVCAVLIFILYSLIFEYPPHGFPPGPKRIRYFGNIHQLAKLSHLAPFEAFAKLGEKFGSIYGLRTGSLHEVVVSDFSIAKEMLGSELWVDRFGDEWLSQAFGNGNGIIFASGDSWREMRRFTLRTLRDFGFGKQKSMESAFEDELNDFIQNINKDINAGKKDFKMRHFFNISVLNILWCLVAGVRFSHGDQRIHKLVNMMNNFSKDFPLPAQDPSLIFPILKLIDSYTKRGKMRKEVYTEMSKFFQETLDARRAEGIYKEEERDFFDVFLNEIDKRKKWTDGVNFYTDEQLCVLAFDLFAAGADTTANTLEFAIMYMLLNPDVKKKVQAEIEAVVGNSRIPTTLDRPNMPYTEATLLEVQRLANIIAMNVRSNTADTTLGVYRIPKGTVGIINMHAMHTDPRVWPNPKAFKPERFLEGTGSDMKVVNAHNIMPFGSGKRVCIGEVLARASLFTYFTTMLQRYDFTIPPDSPPISDKIQVGFTNSTQEYSARITIR